MRSMMLMSVAVLALASEDNSLLQIRNRDDAAKTEIFQPQPTSPEPTQPATPTRPTTTQTSTPTPPNPTEAPQPTQPAGPVQQCTIQLWENEGYTGLEQKLTVTSQCDGGSGPTNVLGLQNVCIYTLDSE